VVVILVVACLLVVGGGIMAVLAIYGTRKYIAAAKTAEAKNALGMMAKDAVAAYESDETDPSGSGTRSGRAICRSASQPIPRDLSTVSGRKYQSAPGEWQMDAAKHHTGFACLKFEMTMPQYYQYHYEATGDAFTGRARGDLNGDGVASTFEVKGQVSGDRLLVAPAISETSPDE
jgi:type IV pilus assembly protein PilA